MNCLRFAALFMLCVASGCAAKSNGSDGVRAEDSGSASSDAPQAAEETSPEASASSAQDSGQNPPVAQPRDQDPGSGRPSAGDSKPAAPAGAEAPDEVVVPPPVPTGEEIFVADAVALVEKLKITSEQRPQYDVVVAEVRKEIGRDKRRDVRDLLSDLREQLNQALENNDNQRVRALRREIRSLKSQGDQFRPYAELFERIDAILSPEQREAAERLKDAYLMKALPDDAVPHAMPEAMLQIARNIVVSDEQRKQLRKLESIYLPRLTRTRTVEQSDYRALKLELKRIIAAILNAEQRARFEAELSRFSGRGDNPQEITADPRFMIEAVRKMDLSEQQQEKLKGVEETFKEMIETVRPRTDLAKYRSLRRRVRAALVDVLTQEQVNRLEAAIEQRREEFRRQGKSLDEFGDEDEDDDDGAPDEGGAGGGGG